MKQIGKWQVLRSDVALDNKWCRVQKDTVELPSGKIIDDYFICLRPDVVIIFPITAAGNVIMVRQYKHGAKKVLMEFPGGVMDEGESPETAAARELAEETGYSATMLELLTVVYDNPTKDTNQIFLFLARDAEKKFDTRFDPTENIETIEIPIGAIPGLIKMQQIKVSGSIALYYAASVALGL
jgi:ADP-ribose pyrophosphatase